MPFKYNPAVGLFSSRYGGGNIGAVIIGDSIPQGGTAGDGTKFTGLTNFRNSRDMLAWASFFSNGAIKYVRNAGVNGDMVSGPPGNVIGAGVAARIGTDAIAFNPRVIFIHIGRNDIVVLSNLPLYLTGLRSCITQCMVNGIIPVVDSILPDNGMSAGQLNTVRLWNIAISNLCRKTGAIFLDAGALMTDPATGLNLAGYSFDGVHPSSKGARTLGLNMATLLTPLMPSYLPALFQDQTVFTTAVAMLDNGLFLTDSGAPVGVPAGWAAAIPANCTVTDNVAAPSPIKGNWLTLACTAAVANATINVSRAIPGASWSPGDTIRIAFWTTFAFPDAPVAGANPNALILRDGATTDYIFMHPDTVNESWTTSGNAYLYTVDYPIPLGTASLTLYLQLNALAGNASSVSFGQLSTVNLSRNAIL